MEDYKSPSFWKKISAFWIDFVFLVAAYLILGYLSEHIFQKDAYPPPTSMQLYSERDFVVYWFFVRWSLILTASYLFICYKFLGATYGQKLVNIKLLNKNKTKLSNKNIILRIIIVLILLLFLMIPGPILAFLYIILSIDILNTAFSVMLLFTVVFVLFYVSFTRYKKGKVRSFKDKLSQTIMVTDEII